MVNYQNGKIYKLVNNVDDEIYVGSTCNPLRVRKGDHKSRAKTKSNYKIYKHLNEVGWENVEIILIEVFGCESKDELHKRERHWIDTLKPSLNKQIPTRKLNEYYIDNREELLKKRNEYMNNNKEKIAKQKKEYRNNNKEKIFQMKKEYRNNNKEKIAEKKKREYNKNKEIVNEQRKIKFLCECGSTLRKSDNSQHTKTIKHLFWEKQYNYIYS